MRRLGLLLCLTLLARAGEDPIVRVYDVADLKAQEVWWAVAMARVKAAAAGVQIREEQDTLVVAAPAAIHEKIAKELTSLREALGVVVTLDLKLAKLEGGTGVASVPAEEIEAFLKDKRAERLACPSITLWNGQRGSLSVLRQVSCVGDFELDVDGQGNVIADPIVSTLDHGIRANLRPFAVGQSIHVAVDASVFEVKEPMAEVELPLPLAAPVKVQVPETTTRSVARLVECKTDAFAVIDLGGGVVLFLRAILGKADCLPGVPPRGALAIELR